MAGADTGASRANRGDRLAAPLEPGIFACRIVESRAHGVGSKPGGKLFLTLGERFSRKEDAQKLDNDLGKPWRGLLYVLTDSENGKLLRLLPAQGQ